MGVIVIPTRLTLILSLGVWASHKVMCSACPACSHPQFISQYVIEMIVLLYTESRDTHQFSLEIISVAGYETISSPT